MTEELPTYNVDLMLQVRNQITTHPETHDQGSWACGTTACIAGWAVQLAGHELDWYRDEGVTVAARTTSGGTIEEEAEEELGLSPREAVVLFFTHGNAEALALLNRMIEAGKNGERVNLDESGA